MCELSGLTRYFTSILYPGDVIADKAEAVRLEQYPFHALLIIMGGAHHQRNRTTSGREEGTWERQTAQIELCEVNGVLSVAFFAIGGSQSLVPALVPAMGNRGDRKGPQNQQEQ